MTSDQVFHLQSYLGRIGFEGSVEPTSTVLEALHARHLDSIPFENIDVRLGRGVGLDLATLQAKLVDRRRGGYCFEQNTLFAAALRAIGFAVETLEARVRRPGATTPLPRTHMVLVVEVARRRWLVDVGFGGDGSLLPVPLDGEPSEQADGVYRVERKATGVRVLRRRFSGEWSDLYAFRLTPALPVDFVVANHFTSTYPSSVFVRTLTVQRSVAGERRILRGRSYTVRRGEELSGREISDDALPGLLATEFGLELSDGENQALVEVTSK